MSVTTEFTKPIEIPFVAFEHYMLADDRPSHPMTCHIRFWFSGKFVEEMFKQALRQVLPRHPIFQMTVEGAPTSKTNHIYWKPSKGLVMPFISWKATGTPLEEPTGGFAQNIYREIGLRFWIRDSDIPSPTQTMMLIQFHHSVCDGIGLFQFMEDLLIAYGNLTGESMPAMRDIDPSVFPLRGNFSLTEENWKQRRGADIARTKTFFKSIAQPVRAPVGDRHNLTETADLHASERVTLPKTALDGLRQNARAAGASVNDLLIRDLFCTLSDWNAEQGASKLWTRIAIPTSLRAETEEKLSAANVVSMVFLSRRRDEIQCPGLLPSITAEMKHIKDHRLGVALPRVVRRLGRYRRALYRFLRLPICSSTAVLTNLGRPFADSKLADKTGRVRVGSITLESLETMPPVRPKTSCSFSVNYYGDILSVTLRYDSTVLSRSSALDILDSYCSRLKTSDRDRRCC